MWIGLLVAAAVVGATFGMKRGAQDYTEAEQDAQEDIIDLTAEAEFEAEQAQAELDADLRAATGQIGLEFEPYDDWYSAQEREFFIARAHGYAGSFDDYIRSQTATELGQYGETLLSLEEQERYHREQLRIASDRLGFQYEQGLQVHEEGVTKANRVTRHSRAAMAATGFRGGTVQSTFTEDIRVRNVELEMYLAKLNNDYQLGLAEIDNSGTALERALESSYGQLGQQLSTTLHKYELGTSSIAGGLDFYLKGLDREFDQAFNAQQYWRSVATGGMQGASWAIGTVGSLRQAGLINWTAPGSIDFGGVQVGPNLDLGTSWGFG